MEEENSLIEMCTVMMVNGTMEPQMVMEQRLINKIRLSIKGALFLGLKKEKANIHGIKITINMQESFKMD